MKNSVSVTFVGSFTVVPDALVVAAGVSASVFPVMPGASVLAAGGPALVLGAFSSADGGIALVLGALVAAACVSPGSGAWLLLRSGR